MFNKMKQINDLRKQAGEIKNALSQETVEGEAFGGKIKIIMDGNQEVKEVIIDNEIANDKSKISDGVKIAVNDAIKKAQRVMAGHMSKMGGFPKI